MWSTVITVTGVYEVNVLLLGHHGHQYFKCDYLRKSIISKLL